MQYKSTKLSGLFDTIFNTVEKVLPVAIGSFQAFQKPKIQGQAKGLAAIQAAGSQIIQAIQQIASNPANFGTLQNAIAEAEKLAMFLSDPQYFYQAKEGSDYTALKNFKIQARNIIAQMTQTTQTPDILPPNTVNTSPTVADVISSQDNTTLYYGIGAAVVLAFVLSRK